MSAPTQSQVDPPHGWLRGLGPWWQRSRAQMRRQPLVTALSVLVILGGLCLAGYYFGYRYAVAQEHFRAAEAALEIDDYDPGIKELKACLEIRPDHAAAHFLLARTLRRAERFADVDEHLTRAERLGWPPDQIALEFLLAGVQTQGPRDEEQKLLYERLQTASPDGPIMLEALTTGFFRHHRLSETFHWLMHWVKHYPEDWRAYLWRGQYFYETGVVTKAREDYETVLRLRPDHPAVHWRLGMTHLKSNFKLDEAVEHFTTYLRVRPENVEALDSLARCQRLVGQRDAARATLDRLFRRQRNYAGAYLTLAQLEADLDHAEFALEALQQFRQRPTASVEDAHTATSLAARLFRQLNRPEEARAAEARLGQFNKELETLTVAMEKVRKGERNPELGRQIGASYLFMGLEAEGRRWLQTVLQENPNDEAARRILAEHEGGKGAEAAGTSAKPK